MKKILVLGGGCFIGGHLENVVSPHIILKANVYNNEIQSDILEIY